MLGRKFSCNIAKLGNQLHNAFNNFLFCICTQSSCFISFANLLLLVKFMLHDSTVSFVLFNYLE